MAKSFLAKLQVLPMMFVFLLKTVSEARHMHLIYANWLGAGIVGAVAGMLTGKPLVVSFRGDDGYLARDRYIWRKLTKFVTGRASLIVPVSRELRDIMLDLGIPREKCRVPRFGVDVDMFHPPSEPRPVREHVRILFVGSLIARKGLHDLLDALADPELATARLTIVGDGPDLEKLRAQSDRLGLADNTEWKGLLPPEAVARLMRHTDLVCLPSYMEGRPNVVNEAMASGLPVISTRIGGIPDMVRKGETAFLVEPGDVEELRKCLIRLVSDPDLRARMGAAGHEFLVKSGVSWDSTAEEFDELFSSL
jgi:glycosyltransferase involved in cell wall biosynthesis